MSSPEASFNSEQQRERWLEVFEKRQDVGVDDLFEFTKYLVRTRCQMVGADWVNNGTVLAFTPDSLLRPGNAVIWIGYKQHWREKSQSTSVMSENFDGGGFIFTKPQAGAISVEREGDSFSTLADDEVVDAEGEVNFRPEARKTFFQNLWVASQVTSNP